MHHNCSWRYLLTVLMVGGCIYPSLEKFQRNDGALDSTNGQAGRDVSIGERDALTTNWDMASRDVALLLRDAGADGTASSLDVELDLLQSVDLPRDAVVDRALSVPLDGGVDRSSGETGASDSAAADGGGTSDSEAGCNGAPCGNVCCGTGLRCLEGTCVCDGTSCPKGCCHGLVCEGYGRQTTAMCGSDGRACDGCSAGLACQGGACITCPAGLSLCQGKCVNAQIENANCGSCGTPCSTTAPSTAQCIGGRCLVTLATNIYLASAAGIVADGGHIFWISRDSVLRVPAGGGNVVPLAIGQSPTALAVDSANAYWGNQEGDNNALLSLPAAVGGTPTVLARGQGYIDSVAVDAASVYWTYSISASAVFTGGVMKVYIGGGDSVLLASLADAWSLSGITVLNEHVYWREFGDGLFSVPAVGGQPVLVNRSVSGDFAVAGNYGYWATSDAGGSVVKMALGGGAVVPIASQQGSAAGFALDDGNLYYKAGNAIVKLPVAGGEPLTIASGQTPSSVLVVDETSVYWVNANVSDLYRSTLMKVTPK